MDNNPSILTRLDRHQSVWTGSCFHDKVLLTLGCRRMMNIRRCLWQALQNFGYKRRSTVNLFLSAMGRISVLSPQLKKPSMLFHQAALAAGGLNDGAPGSRPDYGSHIRMLSRSGWSWSFFWDMQLVQEPQRTCFQTLRKTDKWVLARRSRMSKAI